MTRYFEKESSKEPKCQNLLYHPILSYFSGHKDNENFYEVMPLTLSLLYYVIKLCPNLSSHKAEHLRVIVLASSVI